MNKESSKPLITTIIPTYRRPKLLQRAIRSVLNQTYLHFQVCIYDNASGDETAAVVADIAKEDSRVKYYCHSQNIGSIPNFNYGMERVTTPYFSLLADDNTLLPNFFEDAITTLNRYPEAVFFAGQTIMVDEKGQKKGVSLDRWEPGLISPPDGLLHIWEKGLPTWESVLFRSKVIDSVGKLNLSVGGSSDQDFMMRLARKHIFYISKKPYALFLFHKNSGGFNRNLIEAISSHRNILEHWLKDEGLSDKIKERIKKKYKDHVKRQIVSHIYIGSILGKDTVIIATATELMKKEVGLSYKVLRAIIAARLVNYNKFTSSLVLTPIHWHLRLKDKFMLLRIRKRYIDIKT